MFWDKSKGQNRWEDLLGIRGVSHGILCFVGDHLSAGFTVRGCLAQGNGICGTLR